MEYLNRKDYLNQLELWRDKRVVKAITGLRSLGKVRCCYFFNVN
mgnify:CR=1 FL=1